MAEGEGKSGASATLTLAAGSSAAAAFAGFMLDPAKGLKVVEWLSKEVGAVGFAVMLCTVPVVAVAILAVWLMWNRLKEKDVECQAELGRQREAWKAVVDSKEQDIKEIAKTLSGFLEQVTLLAERARVSNIPTRSR